MTDTDHMTDQSPGTPNSGTSTRYTAPGVSGQQAAKVIGILQNRLNSLTDLSLTLKHIHWNVVGPHFIAVHTMLDPQVDAVREMVDTLAERIATLGGSPVGTPAALAAERSWADYSLGRADAMAHLGALDVVYDGVIRDHRRAVDQTAQADPVTQDLLLGQTRTLEQYQWFVRAHLESPEGNLSTAGVQGEGDAARRAVSAR